MGYRLSPRQKRWRALRRLDNLAAQTFHSLQARRWISTLEAMATVRQSSRSASRSGGSERQRLPFGASDEHLPFPDGTEVANALATARSKDARDRLRAKTRDYRMEGT